MLGLASNYINDDVLKDTVEIARGSPSKILG